MVLYIGVEIILWMINGTEVNCVAVYIEDKGTEVQDIGDETE